MSVSVKLKKWFLQKKANKWTKGPVIIKFYQQKEIRGHESQDHRSNDTGSAV